MTIFRKYNSKNFNLLGIKMLRKTYKTWLRSSFFKIWHVSALCEKKLNLTSKWLQYPLKTEFWFRIFFVKFELLPKIVPFFGWLFFKIAIFFSKNITFLEFLNFSWILHFNRNLIIFENFNGVELFSNFETISEYFFSI